jgi:hypothetical protein
MKIPKLLPRKIAASLACLGLLIFTGSASADNTGSGGTIVYTDSNGLNPVATPPYVGGYVVHTFTTSGTLILPSSVSADVLVVAGGGGGGGAYGDGGGAGGLVYSNLSLSAASYGVTVGAGGAGTGANNAGANGTNSTFDVLLTAQGGGGGGDGYNGGNPGVVGQNGGSGGGGGGGNAPFDAGTATQPSSASGGYGNNGFSSGDNTVYGGGGGAGAAATSEAGGDGLPYAFSGVNTYYAGGGAGLANTGTGLGGKGGGGKGGNNGAGGNGAANTGGGGGGGWGAPGGNGGSGIVIVRYPYVPGTPSVAVTSPANGSAFVGGSLISATATALGGSSPYSVTYHYKLTTAGSYTATAAVGPFGATNTFTQTLGTLANGDYQIYASVTDSAATTVVSVTNTFIVYAAGNTGSGGTVVYTDSNGLNPANVPYVGGYVVQTFTANGTLTLASSLNADVLVVAGGGGGGTPFGDGGGAGGLVYSNLPLSAGSISVTVGAGGGSGANGNNSVFSTLTALGGGAGGSGYNPISAGQNGGSGGGAGGNPASPQPNAGTATQPGSASGGYGNDGYDGGASTYGGGGGAGVAPTSESGGDGLQYAISGVNTYYAGGGAGIAASPIATGGQGGGGAPANGGGPGGNGVASTGGGGGGGWNDVGGSGGSGIVIVRYPYTANPPVSVAVISPINNQTYVGGSSISATAFVAGGTTPYSVTYHYKLTNNSTYTATAAVGPFGATNTFAQTLGTLANGVYQFYATVVDSISSTTTSVTNTFTVYAFGNTAQGGTITYTDPNGLNPVSAPPYVGGYVVQTFTTNDTLILPSSVSANVLVVAGGGGGEGAYGCGGGAGGLIYTNLSLSGGVYPVTVGAGGIGTAVNNNGLNGNNSVFDNLIALGGGGGGDGYDPAVNSAPGVVGQAGGSGGGGGGGNAPFDGGAATQPSSASGGYGNPGATGDGSTYGGGGGAGAPGSANNGGVGLPYAISGATNYYAGGGAGLDGVGSTISAMGGGGEGGNNGPGGNGVANTGGGGGGGYGATGGNGGSGIVIVQYPYVANPPVGVAVTGPTNSQSFLSGSVISATAVAAGGVAPYSVTYHYKLTTAASYTATAAVGPFGSTSTFTQTLGTLPVGAYQTYATVTDSAAGTATSATNTFVVSLTTGITVQDANFETPGAITAAPFWAQIDPVWNPDTSNPASDPYQQNAVLQAPIDIGNEHFTNTCPGGVDWIVLLNANTVSISQDLLASVNAGDTISLTFYGGRALATASTADGGVFTAEFLVGSTVYSTNIDTTVLPNNTWQSYTLTQVVTNSGDLSLEFLAVSGDPWLDNISVTRTLPSLAPVPPVLGAKVSGGNLIVTGTGGTPDAGYTLLSTTNVAISVANWTTNSTGTLDGAGAFSHPIPISALQQGSFFRLRLP